MPSLRSIPPSRSPEKGKAPLVPMQGKKRAPAPSSQTAAAPVKLPLHAPRLFHVGTHEKVLLLKHLTVMLEAGIPLRDALKAMRDQKNSPSLKFVLQSAIKDMADGRQLSFTLNKFSHLFDPFFISTIEVGESSGTLPKTLQYLGIQMDKAQQLQSQIRGALIYPVIVFVGAIGIAVYLSFFLLPQLLPLFHSLTVELPFSTRFLLASTSFFRDHWLMILATSLGAVIVTSILWKKYKTFRYFGHQIILRIPVFGKLLREVQMNQFSRILGTLLMSGVQIVPALKVTAHSTNNLVYQQYLEELVRSVERGQTITAELSQHPRFFSQTAMSMVTVGEQTGTLPRSLLALAEFAEREIEGMTKNLTTLIEPLVLLLVGLLVGFIALSIITPIYQLTQGITS